MKFAVQTTVSDRDWKPLRIGAGGWVTDIDVVSDGTKVVRTDTYGAYIWDGIWKQLVTSVSMPSIDVDVDRHEGCYEICIAPSNSNIIYMYYNGYVYLSTNKGATFSRTNFTRATIDPNDAYRMVGRKMAVDPANSDVVYAGVPDDGVYETDDAGENWSRVSSITTPSPTNAGGITGLMFDATSGLTGGKTNTIYAASWGNGVYVSTNAGSSWAAISGGPTNILRSNIAVNGDAYFTENSSDSLWKYNGSWTEYASLGQNLHTIACDPDDSDRLIVASGGGTINQSLNGGTTWLGWQHAWGDEPAIRIANDIPWLAWTEEDWMSSGNMIFDPVESNTLWFAEGIGVWHSNPPYTYTSFNWISLSQGIEQLIPNEILAVPGGRILAASWDRPVFSLTNPNVFPSVHGPDRDNAIVHGWAIDYSSLDPSFICGHFAWWGIDTKSAYSTDYGQTWTPFPSIPSTDMGGSIAAATPDNIVWAYRSHGNTYYTKNRGTTWTLTDLPEDGYGNQYYLNRHIVAADRVKIGTFYIYHDDNGVYKSTNGGENWSLVFSGAVCPAAAYNAKMRTVPGKADHLFFTSGHAGGGEGDTNPSGTGYFKRSTDGGTTWETISNVLEVYVYGFGKEAPGSSYPAIYIVGWVNSDYGLWRSDDEMSTWIKIGKWPTQSIDRPVAMDGDKDVHGKVYVGLAGSGYVYAETAI